MFVFDQPSSDLLLSLADRPLFEPLLTAIFGVFLIAVAVGHRRLSAFLTSETKHTAEEHATWAQSNHETRLGDLPLVDFEISTTVRIEPSSTGSTSAETVV